MREAPHILALERSAAFTRRLKKELDHDQHPHTLEIHKSEQGFLQAIKAKVPDVVIVGSFPDDQDVLSLCASVKQIDATLPVIVALEKNDLEVAMSCLRAGAADVISKSKPEKIARRLKELLDPFENGDASSHKKTAVQSLPSQQVNEGAVVYRLVHHEDGTVSTVFVSESFALVTGYHPESGSSPQDAFLQHIEDPDSSAYERHFNEALQTLAPFTLDLQIKAASGKTEWLRVSTSFSGDPAGEVLIDTVLVNISSFKHIEAELKRLNAELVHRIEAQSQELNEAVTKQQQTTRQFRQQSDFFYKLSLYSGDLMVVVDRDGVMKYQNPAVIHILGFTPEERVGKSGYDQIHPDDLSFVKYIFTKHRDIPGPIPKIEFRIRHKDGSWIHVEALGNNMLDDETIQGIIIVAWNITERKFSEAKLRESRTLLDSILNTAAIAVCLSDEDGRFVDANPFCCRMFGYTREEIVGKNFTMLLPPEQHEIAILAYRTFITEVIYKSTEQWKGLCKDGTIKELYTTAGIFKDAEMKRFIVLTFTDITDRKKVQELLEDANEKLEHKYTERTIELQETNLLLKQKISELTKTEADLRESSEKFRLTFDQSAIGTAIISLDLRLINANRSFCKIIGYAPSELSALHLSDIAHPDDFEKLLQNFKRIESGKYTISEPSNRRFIHKDRIIVWGQVTTGLVKDKKGNPLYYLMQVADKSEQKQIEATLQDREKQFENILDGISGCVFRISRSSDGRLSVLFISEGVDQLTGFSADEYIQNPQSLFRVVHEDDRDKLIEKTLESFNRQTPLTLECRIICRDGEIKWIRESVRFYKEKNGGVIADGLALDITDLKETEQALKRSENDYRGLFEHAHDPIIIFEPDTEQVLEVNRRACALYGYSREEFLSISMIDVSKYPARGKLYIKELLKRGQYVGFETIHTRKDGGELTLEINSTVISYKGQKAILSINHDVSDRKHIENALRQSKRRYQRIVDTALEGIWLLHEDMSTEYVNQQMADLLGYTPDELTGSRIFKHIFPEDQIKLSDQFLPPRKGHKNHYDIRFIRKNGSIIWALVSSTPRFDQHGDYAGTLFMVTDITERKKMENNLRNSEQRYRILAENFPNGVAMTIDRDYRCILAVGDAFKKSYSGVSEELKGKQNDVLQPPEIAEKFRMYYEAAFKGQRQFFEISHAGREWEAYIVPNIEADGNIETLTVVGHDITHRIKIENELRQRIQLEAIINRVSARLINLPSSEIDTAITTGIAHIANFIKAEEVVVYKFTDDYKTAILTHRYVTPGKHLVLDQETISVLNTAQFHPVVELLRKLEPVIVNDVEFLPENFSSAKDAIRQYHIGSFLVIPIGLENEMTSALGFISETRSERWTKEIIHLLEIFKDIVAHTIARKEKEEELEHSRLQYKAIVNTQIELVSRSLPDGTLTFVNEAYCRYFGKSREDLIGGSLIQYVPQGDKHVSECGLSGLSSEQSNLTCEHRVMAGDGTVRWLQWSNSGIFNENGKLVEVQSVGRDITERRRIEEDLRETTLKLETTVKAGQVGLWSWDPKTNKIYRSAECKHQLGYEEDEIADNIEAWERLTHPDDLKPSWDKTKDFIASTQSNFEIEVRLLHKDGIYRWILMQASVLRDKSGQALRLMGAAMDITERKRVQEALRESEERFRLIFYTSPEAITINRLEDGLCLDINDSFILMTGYGREDIIGRKTIDLNIWYNLEDRKEAVRRMKETGHCQNFEVRFRRKDGSIFVGAFSASAIYLNGALHLISTTRNITEQYLAQDALRVSEERLRIISELISDYVYYGVIVPGKPTQTTWVVGAFEKITGYTVQEVNAMPEGWLSVVHPDDIPDIGAPLMRSPLQGMYEYRIITKSGQVRWLQDQLMPVSEENGVIRLYGGVKDITDHKRAERALVKSEAMYRQSIEQTPHPVFTVDKQGIIRTWNQSCVDFLGYSHSDVMSIKWDALFQQPGDCDKVRGQIVKIMQGQAADIIHVSFRCKDGNDRFMLLYLYPMASDTGEIDRVVFASGQIHGHNPTK